MTSSNGGQLTAGIVFGFLLPLAMLSFATYMVVKHLVVSPQVRPALPPAVQDADAAVGHGH